LISRVSIRNLIKIREADVEIGNVTLLYGPNSEGKSSILKAIELALCMLLGPIHGKEYPDLSDYVSRDRFEEGLNIEVQIEEPFLDNLSLTAKFLSPIERQKPRLVSYGFGSQKYNFLHKYDEREGSEIIYKKGREEKEVRSRMGLAPPPRNIYFLDSDYLSSLQEIGVEFRELLSISEKLKDLKKYLEGEVWLPYLYLYRSSRNELLEQTKKGIKDLYSLGRAKVGELIGDLNMVVGDSMSIDDLIPGRKEIFVHQEGVMIFALAP